ncbi:hypothetical protein CapIbe_023303 [Capra ibex]
MALMKLIRDEEECEATMAVTEENQSQAQRVCKAPEDNVLIPQVMVQVGTFVDSSTQTIQEGIVLFLKCRVPALARKSCGADGRCSRGETTGSSLSSGSSALGRPLEGRTLEPFCY